MTKSLSVVGLRLAVGLAGCSGSGNGARLAPPRQAKKT
jgi:hypothetical protein